MSMIVPRKKVSIQERLISAGYDENGEVYDEDLLPEYDFGQHHELKRNPGWRYSRAIELFNDGGRFSDKIDGPLTTDLVKYLGIRDRLLRGGVDPGRLSAKMRGELLPMHLAYNLFRHTDDHQRYALEARILARQEESHIQQSNGVSSGIQRAYEKLFFHVGDRIDRTDYIAGEVIGPFFQAGLDTFNPERVVKYFGYFGGGLMVDLVLYGFTGNRPISSEDELVAFLDGQIQKTLRIQTLYTSTVMTPGRFDIKPVFEAYTQLLSLDLRTGGQSEQASWIEALVKGMSKETTIPRGSAALELKGSPMMQYSAGSVELRASEQNAYSNGGLPYYGQLESFQTPEPFDPTQEEQKPKPKAKPKAEDKAKPKPQ